MKKLVSFMLAAAMMITMSACAGSGSSTTATTAGGTSATTAGGTSATTAVSLTTNAAAGEEVVIGCLQDITGPTSTLGKMVEVGAKWAIDEINANGTLKGKTIKMITYDTRGDVNEAINAFTRACTTDKVCAIIGPPVANIAKAIAPISEKYDVPVLGFAIDPSAQLKEDGTPYKNMFDFQPNANQQGAIMAKYAMKNNFKTFGVIYNQGNAYSQSLLTPFVDTVKSSGGTIIDPVTYTSTDKDFKTLLNKIIASDVDAIYAPNYTQELILIVQQARALGYEGAFICGLDACPPFNTLIGESCDNIYYINNVDDTEANLKALIKDVKEKTGVDATNKFFLGYDVANILAKIIGEVGTAPADISTATANLKDYEGLTGKISIDSTTHMPVGLEMVMFTYTDTTPKMLERYAAD